MKLYWVQLATGDSSSGGVVWLEPFEAKVVERVFESVRFQDDANKPTPRIFEEHQIPDCVVDRYLDKSIQNKD